MEKEELIDLVQKIMEANGNEEELDNCMLMVEANVPHPRVSDLIFYSKVELTPEEIIEKALAYKPILL